MKHTISYVLVLMLGTCSAGFSQDVRRIPEEPSVLGFGPEYGQRLLFFDSDTWNGLIPEGSRLPELGRFVRFHGGGYSAELFDWLTFGFSVWGAMAKKWNDLGYTNWEGAMAGFFFEARYRLAPDFYADLGIALSCGRFNFLSVDNSGAGVICYTNALLPEPSIGVRFVIADRYVINLKASTFFHLWEDGVWIGTTEQVLVLPQGVMLSLSIEYRIIPEN